MAYLVPVSVRLKNNSCQAKEENGDVLLKLPEPELLDAVLGTAKWMVRQAKKEAITLGSKHIEIVGPVEDLGVASVAMESCNTGTSCGTGGGQLDW